jgi:aspartate 1-decarboxylase
LESPTFTGSPSLPTGTTGITQTSTDSSTYLATTAFVTNAITDGAPNATTTATGKIQLAGDLSGTGSTATNPVVSNAAVIGKVLTGFTSASGTVSASDNLLQAIQKVDGNVSLRAPLASPTFTGSPSLPTGTTGITQTSTDSSTYLATTAFVTKAITDGAPNATTTATGKIQLAGDLSGTAVLPVVSKINGKTIILAGEFTTLGAFATTLTTTGATNLTLPTNGTLATIDNLTALGNNYLPLLGGTMSGSTGINGVTLNLNNNATTNTTTIGGGTTTGAVIIGGTGAQTIAVGDGLALKTVSVGSTINTSTTTIAGGTGPGAITLKPAPEGSILIGNEAGTGTITVGSSTQVQTVNIANGGGVATVNIANASPTKAAIVHIGSTASLVSVGDISTVVPTSTFQVSGSMANTIVNVNGAYTATSSDFTILCNTTTAGFALTLPLATTCKGRMYVIRKIDETSNVLSLPNIKYSTLTTINSLNFLKTIRIQSDGTDWYIID